MSAPFNPVSHVATQDDLDHQETMEKSLGVSFDEKAGTEGSQESWSPSEEWLERFKSEYTGQHGGETLPPGSDPDRVAEAIFTMSVTQSMDRLKSTIEEQAQDYSFDTALMQRCKDLVEGHAACDMDSGDWNYQVCRTAGLIHNWSPYAEVRAVTLPYDEPEETCESFRAWFLGLFWVVICTGINTCKSRSKFLLILHLQSM